MLLPLALLLLAASPSRADDDCWMQNVFTDGAMRGGAACDSKPVRARPQARSVSRGTSAKSTRPYADPPAAPASSDSNPFSFLADIFSVQQERYSTSPASRAKCSGKMVIAASISQKSMGLYCGDQLMRSFVISVGGKDPQSGRVYGTPIGWHRIVSKLWDSSYHRALIFKGLYEIHGLPPRRPDIASAHPWANWTHGCLAVTNEEMDYLYATVPTGTPLRVDP